MRPDHLPRRAATASTARTLPILERLGYTVDTSVDPLFNERRKGGMTLRGRAARALPPRLRGRAAAGRVEDPRDPDHVRHPAAAAQGAGGARTRACRRSPGAARSSAWACAPVWLRPSYTPLRGHDRLRRRACAARARPASTSSSTPASCCPAAAPTRRTRRAWTASSTTCGACSPTSRAAWARAGRTYAEFAREPGPRAA